MKPTLQKKIEKCIRKSPLCEYAKRKIWEESYSTAIAEDEINFHIEQLIKNLEKIIK